MPKRLFWLVLAALVGGLVWAWARQRRDEFNDIAHHFTPPRAFEPPPATTFAPADDDQVAAAEGDTIDAEQSASAAPPPLDTAAPASPPASDSADEIIGYCVRCHTKRPIQHARKETTESGRRAARGTCPVCGANMFTFLAANDDDHGADV